MSDAATVLRAASDARGTGPQTDDLGMFADDRVLLILPLRRRSGGGAPAVRAVAIRP